ncbi:MAG TPA: aldo/keto reductase [Eubacteriaceae bacterium]|nr:aldo/keto reductase [Eubacteriaceae bacterium]
MITRKFKDTDIELSQLGFGCMRFPTTDGNTKNIDKELSEKMLLEAIDKGVNYIDTAWPYHGGESEPFVGEFLQKHGLRDDIYLATKLPMWEINKHEDFDYFLNEQLKRLQTDRIDFYLIHAIDQTKWDNAMKHDILDFVKRTKNTDKVRYLGFSFHDNLQLFKELCDLEVFDFCQIQLNYMDTHFQAGVEGLKYAAEKGLPVIIMEPLKGGKLAFDRKDTLASIWNKHDLDMTPAELAFKYIYSFPEVTTVLSGMSAPEHVEQNLQYADQYQAGCLTDQECKLIEEIRQYLEEKTEIPCTSCQYCSDCPQNIKIWDIFSLYNNAKIYDDLDSSIAAYGRIPEEFRADQCIECGACEEACPQNIEIIDYLKKAHALFTAK